MATTDLLTTVHVPLSRCAPPAQAAGDIRDGDDNDWDADDNGDGDDNEFAQRPHVAASLTKSPAVLSGSLPA